jgi:hypothetical protein
LAWSTNEYGAPAKLGVPAAGVHCRLLEGSFRMRVATHFPPERVRAVDAYEVGVAGVGGSVTVIALAALVNPFTVA